MDERQSNSWSSITRIVFLTFCLTAGGFLIYEHRIHVLGFLPFAFLSICILMHLFMHHGQNGHHGQWRGDQGHATETEGGPDHA